jgi:cytoskeletal protein CcmA (bactofilin family)
MFSKSASKKASKGVTLIAENTQVAGDVRFAGQLFVNGHVDGSIVAELESEATLIISDVGSVKGEIRAPFVVVNGKVNGDVHAGTRVELAAAAKVSGNVYYRLIEMQLGAMVEGQLVHVQDEATTKGKVHLLVPQHAEEARAH